MYMGEGMIILLSNVFISFGDTMTMASISFSDRVAEVDAGVTIESAVRMLERHPDAYIYLIDSTPVPMTTVIDAAHSIDAIRIASGG